MRIYSQEYFLRKILECSETELLDAIFRKELLCQESRIPKKDGYRTIVSVQPGSVLFRLHKRIQKNFLSALPVSVSAKGFIKGSSYVDFLAEHAGHEFFLRLDITDFFGSITKEFLLAGLEPFAQAGTAYHIAELCTWHDRVPQGFATSPAISNLALRRMDQRIRKYCRAYQKERKRAIYYTRYADDMLFSSTGFDFGQNKNFKRMICHILQENGFACNESKTIFTEGEISLSGYVVHEDVHLSRKKLRNINEVIYQFDDRTGYGNGRFRINKEKTDLQRILANLNKSRMKKADGSQLVFGDVSSLTHYTAGWRSFLIQMARTEHGNTGYGQQISKKIKSLEAILDYLEEA